MNEREPPIAPPPIQRAGAQNWIVPALQIAGLWALAVAQPLFDLLARQPEALLAHDLTPARIISLSLVLALGVPAVCAAALALLHRLSPRLARGVGSLAVAVLGAVLALMILARLGTLPPMVHVGLAAALGTLLAVAARRLAVVRAMLGVLAIATVVCPLLFLAAPSLRGLLRPNEPIVPTITELAGEPINESIGDATAAGAPVVMVVFDEWPLASLLDVDGTLNAARYPHLARFAARAHWFRNATTVAHSTAYAVPAILTGRYPDDRRLPITTDYPQNLFTLLAQAGYAMNVTEPHTDLCPESLCPELTPEPTTQVRTLFSDLRVIYLHLVLPRAWRDGLPTVGESWSRFAPAPPPNEGADNVPEPPRVDDAENANSASGNTKRPKRRSRSWRPKSLNVRDHHRDPAGAFRTFVAGIQPQDRPTLHFLHVLLPHMPWRHLPDGRRYEEPSAPREPHGLTRQFWSGTPFEALQGQQRHLMQVAFTDRLVGELMSHLETVGLFDDALIVLVADHGAAFTPGRLRRNLVQDLIADIANVPLLVKMPGQTAGVLDDRSAATVDIVPTLTQALGVPVASAVDGNDLMAAPVPSAEKRAFRSGLAGTGHGKPLRFDHATLIEGRQALVKHIHDHFGRRPRDLYKLGDTDGLLGQRLADLTIASTALTVVAHVDQRDALARVDLGTEPIPARLTGGLHAEGTSTAIEPAPAPAAAPSDDPTTFRPRRLAVAMGGLIRAVTETHLDAHDRERFSAVLGARALRQGANPIRLFEIIDQAGQPLLVPIDMRDAAPFEPFTADFETGDSGAWSKQVGRARRVRQP